METISASLALYEGNPPVTGGFPSKRDMYGGFDIFYDVCLERRLDATVELPVILDAMTLTWHRRNALKCPILIVIDSIRVSKMIYGWRETA